MYTDAEVCAEQDSIRVHHVHAAFESLSSSMRSIVKRLRQSFACNVRHSVVARNAKMSDSKLESRDAPIACHGSYSLSKLDRSMHPASRS